MRRPSRLLAGLLLICGCDHQTPSSANDVNAALGRTLIVPGFAASAASATTLADLASGYCAEPATAALTEVQDAWRQAWLDWKRSSPFVFGPLSDEIRQRIEFFPDPRNLVEARVDALRSQASAPTPDSVAAAPAPAQGFPALEYLLFADKPAAPNDCATLIAVSRFLQTQLQAQADAWPAYVESPFAQSGASGLTSLVETMTRQVVSFRDDELGAPLGINSGNTPKPALAASAYAQESLAGMRAGLETMAATLQGIDEAPGLAAQIRARGAGTYADDVLALLRQTVDGLERVELPLGAAVSDSEGRKQLLAVYDGPCRLLRDQLSQLGGAVGVTPGFNANDGD